MAENPNNEELKQQALATLSEARAEIRAGLHQLRERLTPAQVIHRTVDRHPSLLVSLAFTAGIIPALTLFRGKRQPEQVHPHATAAVTKPLLGAGLLGVLGVLGKSIAPALIKSAILPRLRDSLSGKSRLAFRNPPPAPDIK